MTITISGERGEGKSTTAKLLAFLLKSAGYKCKIVEPSRAMQQHMEHSPLDVTMLKPRDVTIVTT